MVDLLLANLFDGDLVVGVEVSTAEDGEVHVSLNLIVKAILVYHFAHLL